MTILDHYVRFNNWHKYGCYIKGLLITKMNIFGKNNPILPTFLCIFALSVKMGIDTAIPKKFYEYRASAKGALAKGTISSTGTNSPSQVFYGNQSLYMYFKSLLQ